VALRTRTETDRPPSSEAPSVPRALILAVFVVSGAAGLIYQVVWGRELVLVFGNTSQAVSTIVTAFMAGLGLGSLVGGRIADRSRRPLRIYGLLECAIAVLAVLMPFAFTSLADIYSGAYGSLVGNAGGLALTRFGLAFAAIAPVTFLMGMTLPILSRYLVRTLHETGARLGELYAANTFGAMAGTLLAGFVLIELLGLRLTTAVAVVFNLLAGSIALTLSRRAETGEAPAAEDDGDEARAAWTPRRLAVLGATFVSGFVALALQILWTRMVSEGTGSSIYVFSAILAVFLAGITAGSAAYRRWGSPERDVIGVLGLCLAGVGVAALASVVLGSGLVGHVPFLVRAVVVLLPATVLMGYGFPLAGRLINPSVRRTGGSIGVLYAANTLGSILGSFAAAFVLAGWLGTNGSILLLGAVDLVFGAALIATGSAEPRPAEPAEAEGVIATGPGADPVVDDVTVVPDEPLPARGLLTGGRGRWALAGPLVLLAVLGLVASSLDLPITRTKTQNELLAESNGGTLRHREDELATVDAVSGPGRNPRLLIGGVGMTSLSVDTQLMAHLPKALRPQAQDFLVVAMGMGSTYRSGLRAGLRTDVVELSPSVPGMMPVFYPDAGQYVNNPNGRIIVTDGRNYVRLADKQYDLITVDPAPPIESAGSVVLYTREFLTQGKARLKPGGLFTLWMPYALPMEDFKTHARTFRKVFPHTSLVLAPGAHGVYMMGSDQPIVFDEANIRRFVANEQTVADLSTMPDVPKGVTDADGWVAAIKRSEWLDDAEVDAFVGDGPIITDDRPRSEYFLWRRAFLADKAYISEPMLRAATGR
jgi:spermidine synthase